MNEECGKKLRELRDNIGHIYDRSIYGSKIDKLFYDNFLQNL